jgi:hypothetical protein
MNTFSTQALVTAWVRSAEEALREAGNPAGLGLLSRDGNKSGLGLHPRIGQQIVKTRLTGCLLG